MKFNELFRIYNFKKDICFPKDSKCKKCLTDVDKYDFICKEIENEYGKYLYSN